MARIIPSDLTRLALAGAHGPELATLAVLREQLPDADYSVFHGIHWTRQYQGRTLFGEIDFIVLNRAGQVLCIEQKNGPLTENSGKLYKDYPGVRKDVAEQVLRSLHHIREKFRQQTGHPRLHIDYLIYCPEHTVRQLLAAALDRAHVVDATRAAALATVIQALLPPAPPAPGTDPTPVYRFFEQTFEVVPDVHAHISAQDRSFVRLSGGLTESLDRIEMRPLRLRVLATAGNGKTFVARHFFDKALAAGGNPLLLCFNRPLKERLRHLARRGGRIETWYGFCDQFLQSRGVTTDFARKDTDPEFWSDLVQRVAEHALAEAPRAPWRFDALLIDEAQDFEAEWLQILRLFLTDDCPLLLLEDPYQNVRGVTDAPRYDALGFIGYRSLLNFRSPQRIAEVVLQVLPEFPFTPANDLPGLGVGLTPYEDPADQPRLAGRIVKGLLEQRFKLGQIVVLSCRGLKTTVFADCNRIANYTIARFTGEYDLFGNQIPTPGQLPFDTVRRFKGQQAAAVILTDVDPDGARWQQDLQVLFCGMTRATVRLDVLYRADNPLFARRFEAVRGRSE